MKISTAVMLAAAFLPPMCRVLGFTGGVGFIFCWCAHMCLPATHGCKLVQRERQGRVGAR